MCPGTIDSQTAQIGPPPVHEERRGPERAVAVLINAGIAQDGRDGLCRIRNLSAGGIMVETRVPLTADAAVSLQLKSGRVVQGDVRWSKDGLSGIALSTSDAEELLHDRAQAASIAVTGAFPRFMRSSSAYIIADHRRHRCGVAAISLADISLTGVCDLHRDQLVRVGIDGLGEHLAKVNHVEDEAALACFAQPLLFRALEQWLEATFTPESQAPGSRAFTL